MCGLDVDVETIKIGWENKYEKDKVGVRTFWRI